MASLLSQLSLAMWLALGSNTSLVVGVITVRVVTADESYRSGCDRCRMEWEVRTKMTRRDEM